MKGIILPGLERKTGEICVIKMARNQSDLTQEINAYEVLKGMEGFPTYHGHGTIRGKQCIILSHVGCDLDRLLKRHPELFVKEVITFLIIHMVI